MKIKLITECVFNTIFVRSCKLHQFAQKTLTYDQVKLLAVTVGNIICGIISIYLEGPLVPCLF